MNISVKDILVIALVLLVPMQKAAKAQTAVVGPGNPPPRIPSGIYAVAPVEQVLKEGYGSVAGYGSVPVPSAAVNSYLSTFYELLLNNTAVSGLALQVHWDTLNPNPPGDANAYSWDYVQDAFTAVEDWNSKNLASLKSIQLIVTPGFNSPQWMRDELFSCDPLFEPTFPHHVDLLACGKVTFTGFKEKGDSTELPLPWNATYQAAWKAFLQALAKKYNDNTALVSIAVAGPTAASVEMILPNNNNPSNPNTPKQTQFAAYGNPSIEPNQMWIDLLQLFYEDPAFLGTDQAFIDSWEQAIDTYQGIFSGLTLVATTGDGLPNLSTTGPFTPPTAPINFAPNCTAAPNMDCQAETTILEYFAEPVGPNAKATQTSGLEAAHEGAGDLGIVGVRYLSQQTATPSNPPSTSQILGGAQFNRAISVFPQQQASPGTSPKAINQALYNGLQDFFTDTDVAPEYCEPSPMQPAPPLNYLQIYYQDFVYAAMTSKEGMTEVNTAGTSGNTVCGNKEMYFQEELSTASTNVFKISEK